MSGKPPFFPSCSKMDMWFPPNVLNSLLWGPRIEKMRLKFGGIGEQKPGLHFCRKEVKLMGLQQLNLAC